MVGHGVTEGMVVHFYLASLLLPISRHLWVVLVCGRELFVGSGVRSLSLQRRKDKRRREECREENARQETRKGETNEQMRKAKNK